MSGLCLTNQLLSLVLSPSLGIVMHCRLALYIYTPFPIFYLSNKRDLPFIGTIHTTAIPRRDGRRRSADLIDFDHSDHDPTLPTTGDSSGSDLDSSGLAASKGLDSSGPETSAQNREFSGRDGKLKAPEQSSSNQNVSNNVQNLMSPSPLYYMYKDS